MDELISFKSFVVSATNHGGIQQIVFRFPNGYGASVVRGAMLHPEHGALFEIAVLAWDGNKRTIVYDTPITEDVLAYLSGNDVLGYLSQIATLPHIVKLLKD